MSFESVVVTADDDRLEWEVAELLHHRVARPCLGGVTLDLHDRVGDDVARPEGPVGVDDDGALEEGGDVAGTGRERGTARTVAQRAFGQQFGETREVGRVDQFGVAVQLIRDGRDVAHGSGPYPRDVERVKAVARWVWALVDDIRHEWGKDRVGGLSAEIAFFALLGFFPTVIVLAAALGSADGILGESIATDAEEWLVRQMTEVFGGDNTLESTVSDLFSSSNTSAFTVGAVLAVYTASRGFVAVVRALDVAYDHEQTRGWLSTRLVGFGLTLLTVVVAAIVLVLIVVGPLFGEGAELAEDLGVDGWFTVLWTWFRWPFVFLVLVAWAATVFHVAPNHRSPWKYELPGALISSLWWTVVSLGFGQYLEAVSSGANAVFGFLGGALSLLFWLYLMSMGLLLGAEVNSIMAGRLGIEIEPEPRKSLRGHLEDRRK